MESSERDCAGAFIVAKDTGRILLQHRSEEVGSPGTWALWGGGIEEGESPEEAAVREMGEEAGVFSIDEIVPLDISSDGPTKYHSFLAFVPKEFSPSINWESQGYRWVEFGSWPSPLHPGLEGLLSKKGRKMLGILK